MMRPAASDATPDASCCSDALKLMKLPRSLGSTLPVTSAVAGPNRPGTNTKKSTDNPTTQASGSGGRWVWIRIGPIEISARIVNSRCLP